ncbi:MAG: hypothetical protein MK207_04760 [Saprospiraceae bacterium]|nr:hypothetical protein [Saprospiraceae bacterium]
MQVDRFTTYRKFIKGCFCNSDHIDLRSNDFVIDECRNVVFDSKRCFSIFYNAFLSFFAFVVFFLGTPFLYAQDNLPTVPTAIYVGNAVFKAPILGAKIKLVLQENFDNQKRPISTVIGEFESDTSGVITVSLIPDKSYIVTTSKDGFYTQLSKIKTSNFSRTRQNNKGISLRPKNVISLKGNVVMPNDVGGYITLTNKETNFTRTQELDINGNYDIKAVKGDDYDFRVFIKGYIDTVLSINEEKFELVSADEPFVYNFVPNTPQPNYRQGDVLKLEKLNLRFIDRTYRISSEIWLDTLASILNQNRNTKIEIQIHTDSRKSDRLNHILSKKRQELLIKELNERSVLSSQYMFEIKGEDQILNHCVDGVPCSREEHSINNRVVLVVNRGAFIYRGDD